MHATDFWATDAHKVWVKSRKRATYIPDAGNLSYRIIIGKNPCDDVVKCCTFDIIKFQHPSDLCVCVPQIGSVILVFFE